MRIIATVTYTLGMRKTTNFLTVLLLAIGITNLPSVAGASQMSSSSQVAFADIALKAPKNSTQSFSGNGDDVIDVANIKGSVIIKFTHDGDENFIVVSKSPDDDYLDLLVNEIGAYRGTVIQELGKSWLGTRTLGMLEISADGDWTVSIKPLSKAKKWNGKSLSGSGDIVLKVPNGVKANNKLSMRHSGDSNFIVYTYSSKGKVLDLKVNEIGNYSGKKTFGRGVYYIVIQTQGDWKISKKK